MTNLDLLHPSELALRDWVAPQLDASMVEQIAAADYGFGVAEHKHAIDELRGGRLPDDLTGHPEQEVLALTRWSTVEGSAREGTALGPQGARRLHLMRLFSCTVLVRAVTWNGSPVNSLTPLVESAVELGPAAVEPAASYLAWCRLHQPGDWRNDPNSRPVLTLALVVLSALLPQGRGPDLLPGLLGDFVEELAITLDEENLAWSPRPIPALLKLNALSESRRMWVSLAGRCLIDGPAQETGCGPQLTRLGQAIRSELDADVAELRPLLASGPPAHP